MSLISRTKRALASPLTPLPAMLRFACIALQAGLCERGRISGRFLKRGEQRISFQKGENRALRTFQNKGIKIFILFLIFSLSIFIFSPLSVHAEKWEGLIEPYCTGTGLDNEGHTVKDGSCTLCDGIRMAKGFLDFLTFSLALPLAMLAVLIAGVQYTLGGADSALITKAKKLLKDTAYGLAYIFCAWLIINTILAGFGVTGIQGAWDPGKWFVIKCM